MLSSVSAGPDHNVSIVHSTMDPGPGQLAARLVLWLQEGAKDTIRPY